MQAAISQHNTDDSAFTASTFSQISTTGLGSSIHEASLESGKIGLNFGASPYGQSQVLFAQSQQFPAPGVERRYLQQPFLGPSVIGPAIVGPAIVGQPIIGAPVYNSYPYNPYSIY